MIMYRIKSEEFYSLSCQKGRAKTVELQMF